MPDIFDQLAEQMRAQSVAPARQPDIFDHMAAATQPPPRQPDIFDHVEAALQAPTEGDWKTRANAHIATLGLNPSNPTDAGQMYGIYDAYRKQFGTAQDQQQPTRVQTMEGERQAHAHANNEQRGVIASNVIETLHPAGELMARGQRLLAPAVGVVSDAGANNMRASAQTLEETRGASDLSSLPGQLAGSLVKFSNPIVAAVSGGNEAYTQDEAAKAAGAQIGTGSELTHVVGKAALDAVVSKVFSGAKPGTAVASQLEKKITEFIAQKAPEYVAKYGAKAAVGVLVNDAAAIGENVLVKNTVNPNQGVTDNLLESTLMGGLIPVAHEAISSRFGRRGGPPPADETANPSEPAKPIEQAPAPTPTPAPVEAAPPVEAPAAAPEGPRYKGQTDPAYQKAKANLRTATFEQGDIIHGGIADDIATVAKEGLQPSRLSDRVDAEHVANSDGTSVGTAMSYAGKGAKGEPVIFIMKKGAVETAPSDGGANAVEINSKGENHVRPEDIAGVHFADGYKANSLADAQAHWQEMQKANVTTAITDHGKKISFTGEEGQTEKGKYLSTTMQNGEHWVRGPDGELQRVPAEGIKVLDKKLPIIEGGREMSYTKLKEAARNAGYKGVDGPPNLRSLHRFLTKQRSESFTDLPKPPREMSTTMGLKSLRYWAEQSGYNLDGVTTLRDARETVRKQYAHSIMEGRKQGSTQNIDEISSNVPIVKTAVAAAMQKPEVAQAMKVTPKKNFLMRGFENIATPIDSQVKDISPRIYGKMQQHLEYEPRARAGRIVRDLVEPAKAMTDALGGKGSEKYSEFRLALRNQDFATARKLVGPENEAGFNKFAEAFAESRKRAIENGVKVPFLSDYWPSHIKDYEGFRKEYGKNQGQFEDAWDLAEARQGGKPLTDEQRVEIANQVQQGFGPRKPGVGGPGNAKTRGIETITKEQLAHYGDPFESAFKYIETMERSAGRAKFLGKSDEPGAVAASVGKMLQEEIDGGKLDREGQRQLKALLTTRLNGEYLTPSKAIRTWKEATYLTHITSLRSGINQLTDLAITASRFGAGETGTGLKAALGPADHRILNDVLGLSHNGEEFKDPGKLAKVLNLATKTNLFQKIDRLTKDVHSEAAWASFQAAAKNPKSETFRRFERDYKEALGTETWNKAVTDAAAGKKTMESGLIPFMALTEVQPLTLNQMPPAYLRLQNGRVLYALKTFTASSLNNFRRQTFSKLATAGQRREGIENLAKMLVIVGGANFSKELISDMIKGKDINADSIQDDSANALLNLIALSRYTVGKASDKPTDALMNFVTTPIPLADEVAHDTFHATDKKSEFKGLALASAFPIVGDVAYYWTPLGRGWYLNESEAKKEWNTKLAELKKEADAAGVEGDTAAQQMLMAVYNEKSKAGPNPTLTQTVTGRAPEFKPKSRVTAGSLMQAHQRQVIAAKQKEQETQRKELLR
jgi:hypothetical protein